MNSVHVLLAMVEEAYRKPAWHGPHLRGALRNVSAAAAIWRPRPRGHNIAEIALHSAYWKYAARRRLTGEKRGSFPIKGSNWFAVTKLSDAQWKDTRRLLDTMHESLCHTLSSLPSKRLEEIPKGAKVTNARLIYGIAMHDVYHAGQVRILRSLMD